MTGQDALRAGLTGASTAMRALGPARHMLADAGGLVAYGLDSTHRRNAVSNHRRRDPGNARAARRRARASFREYARTNVDFVWANGMSAHEVARRSRLVGIEHVDAAVDGGRGAVLALTHFGNWDFAALMAWAYGLRLTTVMAPIGNPAITDLVIWARERNALEVYTPNNAVRGLLRALRRRRFIALLSDIAGAGPEAPVDYCGGPVPFSLVPAWLSLRTGAPLLPVSCRRGDRGEPDYVALVHPPVHPHPGGDERAMMQAVARALEASVRRHPGQWYPFGRVYADAGPRPER